MKKKGRLVLFSGADRTGKTLAAKVLARELGLPLRRVDLSAVTGKYIGETEKNLSRLLDRAFAAPAVLFFDEADALFGKRTGVRDAHDRYANVDVRHLLGRIEAHEGLVILASNMKQNLDPAFLRRLRSVVEFANPGAEDRRSIWRKVLGRSEKLELAPKKPR